MPSRPRAIRVDEDDMVLADRIRAARPSTYGDTDIFRLAVARGLRLLAAEASMPGPHQYGGFDPAQLAQELRQLLLPALELLATEDAVPMMLMGRSMGAVVLGTADDAGAAEAAPVLTPEEVQAQQYEQNTSDLRSLLSSLDDDDDD